VWLVVCVEGGGVGSISFGGLGLCHFWEADPSIHPSIHLFTPPTHPSHATIDQ
jgi:hypothetical protein